MPIRTIEADAAEFSFPAGPLVVYLWNPFEAAVMARVLTHLEATITLAPRDVYILYVQPDFDTVLATSKFWQKLWCAEFEMEEEDYSAYAFPRRREVCSCYRNVPRSAG